MNELTSEEKEVLINKKTEPPFSGEYYSNKKSGTYLCKQCNAALYRSDTKFDSGCGWPSFDQEIAGAVKRIPDPDGTRTEIVCATCGAHLGHVFTGEHFTPKETRHCVNSISMIFVPNTAEAIFAGGCFWGVEHLMKQQEGVLHIEVGYIGGKTRNPSYKEICSGTTGHAEAVRVIYDPSKVGYETLTKLFFEIHDPTQTDRQGPDIGSQYRSEIFYNSPDQKITAEKLKNKLRERGYDVKTQITRATEFYPAEDYHRNYYEKTGKKPYCHIYTKRF